MLKAKAKGLFVDVSEFSILAARTSGYQQPFTIEEVAEFPLQGEFSDEDVRAFFEGLVDFRGGSYFISRCGVYPDERFMRFYEAESANKLKNPAFLGEVLQSEFNIDPAVNAVSVLNAVDGSDLDLEKVNTKRLMYCGAPNAALQAEQDKLLQYGLYPERLELSSVSTIGGLCDYTRFSGIDCQYRDY